MAVLTSLEVGYNSLNEKEACAYHRHAPEQPWVYMCLLYSYTHGLT